MDHAPQAAVDVASPAGHYPIANEAQLLNDQCFHENYRSTLAHDGVHAGPARMGNQVTPH